MVATSYPVPGKTYSDAQGRHFVVESIDHENIVLRLGTKTQILVISRKSWSGMHLIEVRRAS